MDRRFDGVFANAALFHVPSQELPRVLLQLHATLKPRGVLFASNPPYRPAARTAALASERLAQIGVKSPRF